MPSISRLRALLPRSLRWMRRTCRWSSWRRPACRSTRRLPSKRRFSTVVQGCSTVAPAAPRHAGYGHWRGRSFSGESVRMVVEGIEEHGVLGSCDGVISGYLPSPDTGEVIPDIIERVKSANPAARYCCDPVIGDAARGVFV